MFNKKRYSELLGLHGDFQLDVVLLALIARYGYMTTDQLAALSDMPHIATRRKYIKILTDNKYVMVHSTFARMRKGSGKPNDSKLIVYTITRPGVEYLSVYVKDTSWIKIKRKLEDKANHTLATLDYFYHLAGHPGVHTISEDFEYVIDHNHNPFVKKQKAIADAILNVNNNRDFWLEADLGTETTTQLLSKALRIAEQAEGMDRLDVIIYLPVTRKYFSTVSRKTLEAKRKEEETRYNNYLALADILSFVDPDRHFSELFSEFEQLENYESVTRKIITLINLALNDKITTKRQLNEAIPEQRRIREQARDSLVTTLAADTHKKRRHEFYKTFLFPNPKAAKGEEKAHISHYTKGNGLHVVSDVDEKNFTDLVLLKTGMYHDTLRRLFYCELTGKDFYNLSPTDELLLLERVQPVSTGKIMVSGVTCYEDAAFLLDKKRVTVIDCYFNIANIYRILEIFNSLDRPLSTKLILVVRSYAEASALESESFRQDVSIICYETLVKFNEASNNQPYRQKEIFDFLKF